MPRGQHLPLLRSNGSIKTDICAHYLRKLGTMDEEMEIDSKGEADDDVAEDLMMDLTSNLSSLTLESDFPEKSPARTLDHVKSNKSPLRALASSQTTMIVRQEVSASGSEITAISVLVLSHFFLADSKTGVVPFTMSAMVLCRNLTMHMHTLFLYHFHGRKGIARRRDPISGSHFQGKIPDKKEVRLATIRGRCGRRATVIAIISTIRAVVLLMVLVLVIRGLLKRQGPLEMLINSLNRWRGRCEGVSKLIWRYRMVKWQ